LLFTDAPDALVDKIEQVVRLIRSKGVGVYFVTQNPADIPEKILGQLGNRVQHALRAFTPKDQKGVRAAAQTMRANPAFNTEEAIMALGTGEALISFLDEKGSPSIVEKASVIAPGSRLGPITDGERRKLMNESFLRSKYEKTVDRESAYEMLAKAIEQRAAQNQPRVEEKQSGGMAGMLKDFIFGSTGPRGGKKDGLVQKAASSASRQISTRIVRSILDTIMKR
jgi:DNA helicase HerA-like ATPase